MERYILIKEATKKIPVKYFAGNITKRQKDKIIVTKDITYAAQEKYAYIFTNKKIATIKKKELPSPSSWKIKII